MADVTTTTVRLDEYITAPDARIFDADITGTQWVYPVLRSRFGVSGTTLSGMVANDTFTLQTTLMGPYIAQLLKFNFYTVCDDITYNSAANTALIEVAEGVVGGFTNKFPRGVFHRIPLENNERFDQTTLINMFIPEQNPGIFSTEGAGLSFDVKFQLVTGLAGAGLTSSAYLDFLLYPLIAEHSAAFYIPTRNLAVEG